MAQLEDLGPVEQLRAGRLPLRILWLFLGLTGFGVGAGMLLLSALGTQPWNVMEAAIAERTGLTIGTVVVIVAFLVLALWVPLREKPGLGTFANALWIGPVMDVTIALIPAPEGLPGRVVMMFGGILVVGVFDAVYIGAQLGPGPRDGLMTGLHRRFGLPVGPIRLGIEVAVLAVGWLLGGPVGVGTVAFALLVGPVVHWALPRVTIPVTPPRRRGTTPQRPRGTGIQAGQR
ncbi:membrane protein YczE [Helcobacillus massiliensis]|uniref:membrane protein YczE n=1 Tax=Helcobacillus massiliensis TaxID=521392 RepID=UPI0025557785|nr:hypothetical protein [Helcobacillus massiliensis]MDK7741311.1 hypothetical protein [Helcobacillus massiliensis]WOO92838.1 hypothetical protein R3I40_10595 [Helcobacillus massiliensis]